jgi:hypothetical protein
MPAYEMKKMAACNEKVTFYNSKKMTNSEIFSVVFAGIFLGNKCLFLKIKFNKFKGGMDHEKFNDNCNVNRIHL